MLNGVKGKGLIIKGFGGKRGFMRNVGGNIKVLSHLEREIGGI
jgi:hypothetical protein